MSDRILGFPSVWNVWRQTSYVLLCFGDFFNSRGVSYFPDRSSRTCRQTIKRFISSLIWNNNNCVLRRVVLWEVRADRSLLPIRISQWKSWWNRNRVWQTHFHLLTLSFNGNISRKVFDNFFIIELCKPLVRIHTHNTHREKMIKICGEKRERRLVIVWEVGLWQNPCSVREN